MCYCASWAEQFQAPCCLSVTVTVVAWHISKFGRQRYLLQHLAVSVSTNIQIWHHSLTIGTWQKLAVVSSNCGRTVYLFTCLLISAKRWCFSSIVLYCTFGILRLCQKAANARHVQGHSHQPEGLFKKTLGVPSQLVLQPCCLTKCCTVRAIHHLLIIYAIWARASQPFLVMTCRTQQPQEDELRKEDAFSRQQPHNEQSHIPSSNGMTMECMSYAAQKHSAAQQNTKRSASQAAESISNPWELSQDNKDSGNVKINMSGQVQGRQATESWQLSKQVQAQDQTAAVKLARKANDSEAGKTSLRGPAPYLQTRPAWALCSWC